MTDPGTAAESGAPQPPAPKPWQLLTGDVLHILPTLPPASFDACITDPPYSSGGLYRTDRAAKTNNKYQRHSALDKYPEFPGDGRDQRGWFAWVTLWLSYTYPLLKPGARLYCFTDWRQLPTLTDAVQAAGFTWRGLIPWDKGEGARAPHKGYHRHQAEYIVWATKGQCPKATHGGPWPGLYRYHSDHREKLHIAGKPLALMARLCEATPPAAYILDPFAGSGTTLLAAVQTGRRALGIELCPLTCATAARRLAHATAPPPPPTQATLF